jgi:microsomal epoxide hydrolase
MPGIAPAKMSAMTSEIEPFRIEVAEEVLDDLRRRLADTRWPDQIPGTTWEYGTDLATLKDLCEYWRDGYDWRRAEVALNAWPQFTTTLSDERYPDIDGIGLHFLHARSPHADALPLVITHGWPGSVVEFLDILGPLTDPTAHGGDAADAFHVVAPSMPGYGFSGPTDRRGVDIKTVAECNAALMRALGYERYGAQGGDWGAIATAQLGLVDADHLAGLHVNMVVAGPPEGQDAMEGVQPEEMEGLMAMGDFVAKETGYQQIQGTKPQTLAYGLTDSPAGLAGWILEKFRTWSDCGGDVYSRFTRDQLLTNITVYWVTGTINASTRLYYETMQNGRLGPTESRVEVPTGVAVFPCELYRPPRAWAEHRFNITRWTRMESGGHFAAMEEPEVLVDDIRAFFRTVR